jgi:hypothetical protein
MRIAWRELKAFGRHGNSDSHPFAETGFLQPSTAEPNEGDRDERPASAAALVRASHFQRSTLAHLGFCGSLCDSAASAAREPGAGISEAHPQMLKGFQCGLHVMRTHGAFGQEVG